MPRIPVASRPSLGSAPHRVGPKVNATDREQARQRHTEQEGEEQPSDDWTLRLTVFVDAWPVLSETFVRNEVAALRRGGHAVWVEAGEGG